ncbi:hypothetical protein [Nitrosopumilus sp.]|uniref:hypothetical protein n=1 Tax=Nitrosopumilus sp. TaxID=2024843 RepID=UPI00247B66EA|nr:hypothetical protein [Nitrosopumilus sp.]MCV0430138.1 hypothetical protein [Nitrosopumilus sp.]
MGENTTISWEPGISLKWNDFQAESNPAVFEDSHSVIKYRFTWIVNSDKIDGKVVFLIENIQLFAEFHPLLSWVRLSESTDTLLNHEQGKFDLAELIKCENIFKIHEKFYDQYFPTRGQNEEQRKQFAKEDSGKMINEEVEKLQKLFDDKCLKYHADTNFGQNPDEQSKYDRLYKQIK